MLNRTIKRKISFIRFGIFMLILVGFCLLSMLGYYDSNKISIDHEPSIGMLQHQSRHLLSLKEETHTKASVHKTSSEQSHAGTKKHKLNQTKLESVEHKKNTTINCVRPDIEQFPKSFFDRTQRLHGMVIFNFIVAIYMFIGLAIVCDDYFVPSLELVCKKFNLREDVAGATFMAAGSSGPELATTIISLFIAKDVDIGIGAVVGSAVFNIMFVVSIVALLSGMIIQLSWYPIFRDSACYLVSILAMVLIIVDEKVYWYEAAGLLILYALYLVVMYLNLTIEELSQRYMSFMNNEKRPGSIKIEGNNYNTLNNEGSAIGDLAMNNYSSSSSLNADALSNKEESRNVFSNFENGDKSGSAEPFSPFKRPDACEPLMKKIQYYVSWPLLSLYYISIPNCQQPAWQKFYLLTFLMSLIWTSILSYVMMWMITIIGYTFLIPDTIMGLTLIAFGASVPDALSSLLVAKNGQGDMAVSNAIGSNVFDILVCLGLPWFIRCLTEENDSFISVKSRGLTYSTLTLFGTVLILILSIRFNKWQLDRKIGIFLMIIYVLFILLSSMYELNVLGSNHLPMCTDSDW